MLRNYYGELVDGTRFLLKDVYHGSTGDARVRTASSDGVECRILAWSAANDSETHQEMKDVLEAEMGFPVSEAYSVSMNAKSLVDRLWQTSATAIAR